MSLLERLTGHIKAWRRILLLSRKPDDDEFKVLVRLALMAILIVGAIAYVAHLIYVFLVS